MHIASTAGSTHQTHGTKTMIALIEANSTQRQFGFLGEPGVNVLELNLALDEQSSKIHE